MKVSHTPVPQDPPPFKKFKLEIELETPEEAAELHAIFNHGAITSAVPHLNEQSIRSAIRGGCGSFFPSGIEHAAYSRLCKVVR